MRILISAELRKELGAGITAAIDNVELVEVTWGASATDNVAELFERANARKPVVAVLDDETGGGSAAAIQSLRSEATVGPAVRFVVRSARSTRPPADGVIAVPRGDGEAALIAAVVRMATAPVRATAQTFALLEVRGRATGQRLHEARVVDVSLGGVKLCSPLTLRLGEFVSLAFTLDLGQPLIVAGARIVRHAGEESGAHFYGLEFVDLYAADRETIAKFVANALIFPESPRAGRRERRRELAAV